MPGIGTTMLTVATSTAGLIEKIGGAAEDPDVVLVEAEHDARGGRRLCSMQVRDQPAIVADAVVPLLVSPGLSCEIDSKPRNSALHPLRAARRYELFVPRGRSPCTGSSTISSAARGPEELLRVARIGADVIVPEHYRACRARRDLAHDLVDRTIAHRARTVEERDRAVVTSMRASARCDGDRLPVAASP